MEAGIAMKPTIEILNEIRGRCEAATKGPWHEIEDEIISSIKGVWPSYNPYPFAILRMVTAKKNHENDRIFVKRSRTDLPRTEQALRVAVKWIENCEFERESDVEHSLQRIQQIMNGVE